MTLEWLSPGEILAANAVSVARSCACLLARRVLRDSSRVSSEYHSGHWARVLEGRVWERATSLEEFLVGARKHSVVAKVDGKFCRLGCDEFYRYRLGALAQVARAALGEEGDIVELGCGFGYNLFALALAFPGRRFIGLDVSSNGIDAARAIANHFGLDDRMQFETLDLTRADDPNFALLRGRAAFSYFCIEQIPYEIEQVVTNILAAGPCRVLHVEPTVEFLSLWRPKDWANYFYVKSVDYQTRLFGVLCGLEQRGLLRVRETGRIPFAPTIQNDGFIAVWEPTVERTSHECDVLHVALKKEATWQYGALQNGIK